MERMKEHEERLASAGTFCPNEGCHHYAKVDEANIIKFGKRKQGVQRYQCNSCRTTFSATRGTLFYRKHTPLKDILETLALLAEGVRISSLSRAKGFKEDTILRWLREAARHSEAVEDVLLADYRVSKGFKVIKYIPTGRPSLTPEHEAELNGAPPLREQPGSPTGTDMNGLDRMSDEPKPDSILPNEAGEPTANAQPSDQEQDSRPTAGKQSSGQQPSGNQTKEQTNKAQSGVRERSFSQQRSFEQTGSETHSETQAPGTSEADELTLEVTPDASIPSEAAP